MKIITWIVLFILPFNFCFSQANKKQNNSVGISIPLLFNNSNGVYYSLGNRREPIGKSISFGINVNYTKVIYKSFFVSVGAGYFKQSFNIIRPFNFSGDTQTNLLYSTKSYSYDCLALNAGIGYSIQLNQKLKLNGVGAFTMLNSFKQSYDPNGQGPLIPSQNQINKMSLQIGYMANVSIGGEYRLTNNISVGMDIVVPVKTKWQTDKIFIESFFGNDAQKIAENRFSIGTMLSCKYHF